MMSIISRALIIQTIIISFLIGCKTSDEYQNSPCSLTAPKLTNNPYYDIVATNTRPLLSFFNSKGGSGQRTYTIQISKDSAFKDNTILEYQNTPEQTQYITSKLIEEKDALENNKKYYWRVRAEDEVGSVSPWEASRFYIDTKSDDSFMDLIRVPVEKIEVSSGEDPKNIIDISDVGLQTYWSSAPPGDSVQWVNFDLGHTQTISRIFMLSNPSGTEGWLIDFIWQRSQDGSSWSDINNSGSTNNDTYRNIIDVEQVESRYLRLLINKWYGFSPQLNTVILYSPGKPSVPEPPDGDYVLVVGNQLNGYTFTELAEYIEGVGLNLKTLTVPHYEVSMGMINNLSNKPVAIILSGNNADYQNLPMFEYNGEYEIIRECEIPILGICAGHQLSVMAYGYTYARSMGWPDITAIELEEHTTPDSIHIINNLPIFDGIPNPFVAVEIHGWSVAVASEVLPLVDYEILAMSSYVQAHKSKKKMLYGEQFHAEVQVSYNQGHPYLINFLKMAIEKKNTN
jgi:anthranilate/para-aminobenzoate synthase component II